MISVKIYNRQTKQNQYKFFDENYFREKMYSFD